MRVERPSFSSLEPPPRFPYDELFDAVESGTTAGSSSLWVTLTGFARLRKGAAIRRAWDRALPLGRLVRTRVRCFGWVVPTSAVLALALAAVFGGGLLLGRITRPAPAATPLPAPSASAAATPSAGVEAELEVVARAALGDPAAIEAVEQQPASARSAEAVLAPFFGRLVRERQSLVELRMSLTERPERVLEPAVLGSLDAALQDPRLVGDALAALASVQSTVGPDLLFELHRDRARSDEARALAGSLLLAVDVAAEVSRPLRAVLALDTAVACRAIALAVHDAEIHADVRAIPALQRLSRARSCEDGPDDDCAACRTMLDASEPLVDALREREYKALIARSPAWAAPSGLGRANRAAAASSAGSPTSSERAPDLPAPEVPPAPAREEKRVPSGTVTDPGF